MNNSVNVQSPSFGMAFFIKDLPKFKETAAKLTKEEKQKLTDGLRYAEEKLGTAKENKTPMSDLMAFIDGEGNVIYRIETKCFDVDPHTGVISQDYATTGSIKGGDLKSLVDSTVERNKNAISFYEKAVKESADIENTNADLGEAFDVFAV